LEALAAEKVNNSKPTSIFSPSYSGGVDKKAQEVQEATSQHKQL
jgi:hypothetical protein